MGQDVSRAGGASEDSSPLPVLEFPTDIVVPEAGQATASSEEGQAAPAPASEAADPAGPSEEAEEADPGARSVDQLPTLPAAASTPGGTIIRDLGDYQLEKQVLGEGAFGKVRLATSKRTAHQVAVKVIKRKKLNDRAEVLLQREVKHHEKLRHANIVRLHTFIMTPTKYYLVMEYCEGGDLLHYINGNGLLSDELAARLFRGLLEGIRFCHVLGIHHRDLKLENIMLSSRDEKTVQLKIADFGLSDLQTVGAGGLSSTFCGSPLYAAPELMTTGAAPDGYDAGKSDVWSCGVVLYALLASALPFDADDICALVRLIQNGVPNSPVPAARGSAAAELVGWMLTVEPKERPTATEVLNNPYCKPAEQKAAIKSSMTTPSLPGAPKEAGGGAAASGAALEPGATTSAAVRRRGASATTAFFKAMMLAEANVPQTVSEEANVDVSEPPPGGDSGTVEKRSPTTAAQASPGKGEQQQGADGGERPKGKEMTRAEIAELKMQAAELEANEAKQASASQPQQQQQQGGRSADAGAAASESATEPSSSRKGGMRMTAEEWAEIRRERREERARQGGGGGDLAE
jgi:5'-AMP-activated protein kinase catalytic alpha subunit